MFGKTGTYGAPAIGVTSGPAETAVVRVEGTEAERPRVLFCELLDGQPESFYEFCKMRGLRRGRCVDVLPPGKYNLIQVDVQNLKVTERREAVRWQVRELIDYPAEDAIIDLFEVPLIGTGEKFKTYAVVAAREQLQRRARLYTGSALQLKAIDIPEFALRNLLELYKEETRGLCLLWLRADNSLLVIVRGDVLYFSRLINIGMKHLQTSDAGEAGTISESMQLQLDSVVLEIQRSLDYCESNFRLPPVPKILVAMCGEESQDVIDYLDRYLQATVTSADFRQVLDLPQEIDSPTINSCLPALGAALRAGGRA